MVLDVKKVKFSENSYLPFGWSGVGWGWIWLSLGGFRVILDVFIIVFERLFASLGGFPGNGLAPVYGEYMLLWYGIDGNVNGIE